MRGTAVWDLTSPSGKSYVVDAPADVPEADVMRFAQANDASWKDGGRYLMPVQNARREADAKKAMTFSPAEEAQITSFEQAPENVAEWRKAIEEQRDPELRRELQAGLDETLARPKATSGLISWDINSPDGQKFTVRAPSSVPEAAVIAFAQERAPSWQNGGTYTYEVAPKGESAPSEKQLIDAHVAGLSRRIAQLEAQRGQLAAGEMETAVTPGGAATGRVRGARDPRVKEMDERIAAMKEERDSLIPGSTGQTVGGIGGALVGGGLGALFGGPIGGVLGGILGAAGGTAAGTALHDIPELRDVREVSDQEAADLIKSRVIESLIWDGAFVLILGPGGRVVGKMLNGSKFKPALTAAAKESIAWDAIKGAKGKQLSDVVAKRAKEAPKGLTDEASRALGVPAQPGGAERLIGDIADATGGRVPTTGEMRGMVGAGEATARKVAPKAFFENDKILSETAEKIRQSALGELDRAGAYGSLDMGNAVRKVVDSADTSLRRATGPVFERAAQQNVFVNLGDTKRYIDSVLLRDERAAKALLEPGERARLLEISKSLSDPNGVLGARPFAPRDAQDLISGAKSALRGLSDETRPSVFMEKVLNEVIDHTDRAYLDSLRTLPDKTLTKDLLAVRKLYRESRETLFSDSMATLARKTPEDVGRALMGRGTITEIRDLRKALDKAVELAPQKSRLKGGEIVEFGRDAMAAERQRIDAGLVKGFIEQNTRSLTGLSDKLTDPLFRDTLKELLTGPGAANTQANRKVLAELDRTLGVMKLIKPEMAPQPGRVAPSGIGGMGVTTAASAVVPSGGVANQGAISAALTFIVGGKLVGKAAATAMTTGNVGALRAMQRAVSLAQHAGKSPAAAEAFRAAMQELSEWDKQTGGEGSDGQ
jgi:outer membrane lipoprotein SlyB